MGSLFGIKELLYHLHQVRDEASKDPKAGEEPPGAQGPDRPTDPPTLFSTITSGWSFKDILLGQVS